MIDFHSHILPAIDDGSKNTEVSLLLLKELRKQGITKVVATPHYYPDYESVDEFLSKREKSYSKLKASLTPDLPEVVLGAEVKYYEGISRNSELHKLTIGNSKLLLLEMPMKKWTEYTLNELRYLATSMNITIVLAHIERYLNFQDKKLIKELVNNGILIQSNAEFFLRFSTKRKALSMLCNNSIHFLGSDCHNLTSRAPKIGSAYSYIERKTSKSLLLQMQSFAERFL